MFTETRLKGAFIIELGGARTKGLFMNPGHCPTRNCHKPEERRGMHFQFPPAAESKLDLAVRRRS